MKIAIAANTSDTNAEVAAHGARAPFYLIFDASGRLQSAPANPLAASGRQAGPAAAEFLAGQDVALVAAGDFGPHFVEALEKHGIDHVQTTGRVADVIARLVARRGEP